MWKKKIDTSIEENCKTTERTEEINVLEKQNTKDAARLHQNNKNEIARMEKISSKDNDKTKVSANQQLKTDIST